jgi:hypothetical protein
LRMEQQPSRPPAHKHDDDDNDDDNDNNSHL